MAHPRSRTRRGVALLAAGPATALLTACSGGPDDATTEPGELAVPTPGEVMDPAGASVAPEVSRVAVPCHGEWVCLWRSDSLTGVLPGATATAWVPPGDDALLVTVTPPADPAPGLVLQDPDSGREVARLGTGDPVTRLVTTEDGATLAAVAGERVLLLDPADLGVRTEIPLPGLLDLALAPGGRRLVVAVEGEAPTVVDARSGRAVRSLGEAPAEESEQTTHVAWGPGGGRVATGSQAQVRVWEPQTGEVSAERAVAGPLSALDVGPDDVLLALAAGDGQALVLWSWAGEDEQVLDELALHPAERLLWREGEPSRLYSVSTTELRSYDVDVPTEQSTDDPPFPDELEDLALPR